LALEYDFIIKSCAILIFKWKTLCAGAGAARLGMPYVKILFRQYLSIFGILYVLVSSYAESMAHLNVFFCFARWEFYEWQLTSYRNSLFMFTDDC